MNHAEKSISFFVSIVQKKHNSPVKEAGLMENMDGEVDRGHPGLLEFWGDGGPSKGSTPAASCCRGSWFFSFRHLSRDSRRRSSFWEDSCTRDWAWREDKHCVVVLGLFKYSAVWYFEMWLVLLHLEYKHVFQTLTRILTIFADFLAKDLLLHILCF